MRYLSLASKSVGINHVKYGMHFYTPRAVTASNLSFFSPSKLRNFRNWIAALLLSAPLGALANTELLFSYADVCTASGSCNRSLIANGVITAKSAAQFAKIVGTAPAPLTVFLNGSGNDYDAGIALGRAIRAKGFNTQTGALIKIGNDAEAKFELREGGDCVSACLIAFVGGVTRTSQTNDVLGFTALRNSAQIPQNASKTRSQLEAYLLSMGVNADTLNYLNVGGNEQNSRIPFATASKLNIDNHTSNMASVWRIKVTPSGRVVALNSEKDMKAKLTATLALTNPSQKDLNAKNNFRLIVFVKPINNAFDQAQYARFSGDNKVLIISSNGRNIRFPIPQWEINQDGMQTSITLSKQDLSILAEQHHFEMLLQMSDQQNSSTKFRFGTAGLNSSVAALSK